MIMIKLKLAEVMAVRGIQGKVLAEEVGVSPQTIVAHRKHGLPKRFSVELLGKYCEALGCQPGDLLEYVGKDG